jgi:hypothetical protein
MDSKIVLVLFQFPSPLRLIAVFLCVVSRCMPRLKETRLQIEERTEREIRHRTAVRIAQLHREAKEKRRETEGNEVLCNIVKGESRQEGRPVGCARCKRFDLVCDRLLFVFLVVLVAICLDYLYHADKKG